MSKADIKLGYSCNNQCIHCVISDFRDIVITSGMPEDISAEQYKSELRDSRRRTDRVVFTGGEPTIRPELQELVAYARDLGFKIMIQTNGRRLARMDYAVALCSLSPLNFCIALHGPNPQIHDQITRKPGSFYETVQGIRNIIEIRGTSSSLSGKIVISKINAPYLVQTTRFMLSLGFSSINLTFPHACGDARKNFFEVVPRYSDIKQEILNCLELCLQQGVGVDTETVPLCILPGYEHLAMELNINQEEYTELKQYGSKEKIISWNKIRLEIKSKSPRCKECRFDPVCEGPWNEYPRNYGFDEFIPVPGEPVHRRQDVKNLLHRPPLQISRELAYTPDLNYR